jgi:hypothetical protein
MENTENSVRYFIWVGYEVSSTYKAADKTTVVLCILIFGFLNNKREDERIRTD